MCGVRRPHNKEIFDSNSTGSFIISGQRIFGPRARWFTTRKSVQKSRPNTGEKMADMLKMLDETAQSKTNSKNKPCNFNWFAIIDYIDGIEMIQICLVSSQLAISLYNLIC